MRKLLFVWALSTLLPQSAFSDAPLVAASHQAKVASSNATLPRRFSRWINRRTRPVGRAFEKVLPFRLVKIWPNERGCHRCFSADTRISLPGGATCAISDLRVGQVVLGWDPATNTLDTVRVKALAAVRHDSLRSLSFADGRTVMATADHPFWVQHAGWSSLAPALTTARYATGVTRLLHPGDRCLVFSGAARLTPTRLAKVVTLTACGVPTYTIVQLNRGNIFFANGLAVGVEDDKSGNGRWLRHHLASRHR